MSKPLMTPARDSGSAATTSTGTGPGAEAGAVEPHLHPYAAKLLLGTVRLNPKTATAGEGGDAVVSVRRAREREWEWEHVRALGEGLGSGWAVNGLEASLGALARGQVRTLLVDAARSEPGYRCRGSGRLTLAANACADEGGAEGVPDVIDDAIEVRENIVRHVEHGEDHYTAARHGTSEIGFAVLATTSAVIAVFVPGGSMHGIGGRVFFQFGITVGCRRPASSLTFVTPHPSP